MSDFDLDDAVQLTSAAVTLRHPVTGEQLSAKITIAGPEHPARKAVVFERMRRARSEFERHGKLIVPDPADDEALELDLLAAVTLGWQGIKAGGVPIVFSAEAARALYADPRRAWVRDQVKAALDQRALFIESCATS